MTTIGSEKISSTVIPAYIDGVESIIEFNNGLAQVSKKAKKFLLERSPDLYFDPDGPKVAKTFSNDLEAIGFYINKCKANPDQATRLCAMLKAEYENLQGELLSGKYAQKAIVSPQAAASGIAGSPPEFTKNFTPDVYEDDLDELVTGDAGDSINEATEEDSKKKKKKKKKNKKK